MVKILMKITLIVKDRVVGVVVPIAVWPKLKAIVWQFCETSKYTEIKMNRIEQMGVTAIVMKYY